MYCFMYCYLLPIKSTVLKRLYSSIFYDILIYIKSTVQNSYWLKSNVYHTANRELTVISLLKKKKNAENFKENSFE